MNLLPGWYAIADSKELKNGTPLSVTRFDQALVIWRDEEGKPTILLDRCPHRSAKLSDGELEAGCIVCPFHGFKYSGSGECVHVPETGQSATNLKVDDFPCREAHGFIWMWHGPVENLHENLPWFEEIDKKYAHSQITQTWNCHFSRCVENQLDYAHLPYVHKTTIGRFHFDPKIKVDFDLSEKGIKFSPTGKAFIEMLFPNIWRNYISEDFQLVLAFAPVAKEETKLYLRAYFSKLNIPVIRSIAGIAFSITNTIILNQDKDVVTAQVPRNSLCQDNLDEKLFPSDKAIKYFREVFKLEESS